LLPAMSSAWAVGIAIAVACTPIEPVSVADAPVNACPCEGLAPGKTAAQCSTRDRCEILAPGGRPDYPFWIVVHVPTSSFFAPGHTYVLSSEKAYEEKSAQSGVGSRCRPPLCLLLGGLGASIASYRVSGDASRRAGVALVDGASVPVRTRYEYVGLSETDVLPRLPLDTLFASSRPVDREGETVIEQTRDLPAGRYLRVFYPDPPFDEVFPPVADERRIRAQFVSDTLLLGGDKPLDDIEGDSRLARIERDAGLEGFRVWLRDRLSERRISVVKTLKGRRDEVQLVTAGEQRTDEGGLGDDVEAIVTPPQDTVGLPRLVSRLFGGAGLKNLVYPPLPLPVNVSGRVARDSANESENSVPSKVSFASQSIATLDEPSKLLRYETSLSTDERGRFATVLPPGMYVATIEPRESTKQAKWKEIVVVGSSSSTLRFVPFDRTRVDGRAVVTDRRVLRDAEILAEPDASGTSAGVSSAMMVTPRVGRGRTDADGRFMLWLDPGRYLVSVTPKAGTGFPRVVVPLDVPSSRRTATLAMDEVRVPAPMRLAFTLRAPTQIENPVVGALVRVFAARSGGVGDPVELGSSLSDPDGAVEILLADPPR
jgi:hypothetical protein